MNTPGPIISTHFPIADFEPTPSSRVTPERRDEGVTMPATHGRPRGAGPYDGNEDFRAVTVTVAARTPGRTR